MENLNDRAELPTLGIARPTCGLHAARGFRVDAVGMENSWGKPRGPQSTFIDALVSAGSFSPAGPRTPDPGRLTRRRHAARHERIVA